MGQFEGDNHAVEDHGRTKAGSDAEEEHVAALVTAESLHGGVIDEAKRLPEGLLIRKIDPSRGEIVGLGNWPVIDDRAWVADGDAVAAPGFGGSENIFRHLLGGHFGAGRNFDGNAFVAGGYFDVGTADIDYEDFHLELDGSNDRRGGIGESFGSMVGLE